MDFLPIWSNGERTYAGFWRRFWAGLIDFGIIALVWYLSARLWGHGKNLAIAITILFSTLSSLGYVFFNARFGGTPGKLAVAIRITKPDGARIGWLEAWKRSSVDLLYAIVFLYVSVAAMVQVDAQQYSSFGFPDLRRLLQAYHPPWFRVVNVLEQVWYWGELIVLLSNKRRRAIHDFIAGTVVIHKRFAEQMAPSAMINYLKTSMENNDRLNLYFIEELGNSGYRNAIEVLGLVLKYGKSLPEEKAASAIALSKLGDYRGLDVLKQMRAERSDPIWQQWIDKSIKTLEQIKSK